MRYIFSLRYLLVLFALLCTACGTALPTVKPYKLDVQQGNVVTSKMLLQLRPGMTKSQVRFIMGTPLIQDSFHGNRWDYVYQLREKGKIVEQRRVILDFENELLKAVRGDVIPAGSGPKEAETANTGTRTVQPVDKAKDKSFMDKLKFWKKDEVPPAAVTPAVVVPADNASKPQQSEPQPVPDVDLSQKLRVQHRRLCHSKRQAQSNQLHQLAKNRRQRQKNPSLCYPFLWKCNPHLQILHP